MSQDDIRSQLAKVAPGTAVTVKLDDGSSVTGNYQGTDGEQVLLEDGADPVELGKVETVLMDVSSAGPE